MFFFNMDLNILIKNLGTKVIQRYKFILASKTFHLVVIEATTSPKTCQDSASRLHDAVEPNVSRLTPTIALQLYLQLCRYT